MPQSTLPWQWRGERRRARLYSHFRLHRTGHSDRHDAFGGGESSPATEFIIEGGRKRRLILRLRLRQQSRQPKEANGFANVPVRAPPTHWAVGPTVRETLSPTHDPTWQACCGEAAFYGGAM